MGPVTRPFSSSHPRIKTFPYYFKVKDSSVIVDLYLAMNARGLVWCHDFLDLTYDDCTWMLFKKRRVAVSLALAFGPT